MVKQITKYVCNYIKHKKRLFPRPYLLDPYPLSFYTAAVGGR